MKNRTYSFLPNSILPVFLILFFSCQHQQPGNMETWKEEIRAAEAAFAQMAATDGLSKAFRTFAADDAVLMRNNKVFKTKEELNNLFSGMPENVRLEWSPDFVDVAASGDLGYTYGEFTYTLLDSLGNEDSSSSGIFHTVWKRQEDGSWKYVWD